MLIHRTYFNFSQQLNELGLTSYVALILIWKLVFVIDIKKIDLEPSTKTFRKPVFDCITPFNLFL